MLRTSRIGQKECLLYAFEIDAIFCGWLQE